MSAFDAYLSFAPVLVGLAFASVAWHLVIRLFSDL